jgi:hypothetical protein
MSLVVLAVSLTLGIQHARPVVGFEVELSVDINLDFNATFALADGVGWDTDGGESSTDELSNSGRAPWSDDITGLQGELGSKNGVLDGSIGVDFTERKGLVDGRALVSKSINSSLRVDSDTDSKTTGNSRSGKSSVWDILGSDARNVLKLRLEFGHRKSSAGNL